MNNAPLFRPEVFEGKKASNFGHITLIRPISFHIITGFFLFFLATIVLIAFFGTYTNTTKVSGYVTPRNGVIKVVSTQSGIVADIKVREGQIVHKGDVLCVISLERTSVATREATSAIARDLAYRRDSFRAELSEQEQLSHRQADALKDKVQSLMDELSQLDSEIALQTRRIELAEDVVNQYQNLEKAKFSPPLQTKQKEDDLLDKESRKQTLLRTKTSLKRDLETALHELQDIPVKSLKENANSQRNIASIDQELMENDLKGSLAVLAPQDGTISSVMVSTGQSVQGQGALLDIVPENPIWQVELFASSKSIGFVRAGQKVLLRYQAFPYQKFGLYSSTVESISLSPLLPAEIPSEMGGKSTDPQYRITLALDRQNVTAYGLEVPLRAGMQVDGDVQGDKRKILEWIFEPIYGLQGSS